MRRETTDPPVRTWTSRLAPIFTVMRVFALLFVATELVDGLDLQGAIERSLAHNLQLDSSRLDLVEKERARDTAWNVLVPQLALSATTTRLNEVPEPLVIPGLPTVETPAWSAGLSVQSSLTLSPAMLPSVRQTHIDVDAALLDLEQARRQLVRDVKLGFVQLLFAERNAILLAESIAVAARRLEQARADYQTGRVPELEVLSAQVSLANLQPQRMELEHAHRQALLSFKMLLGMDSSEPLTLDGTLETPRSGYRLEALLASLAERPDVRAMAVQMRSLENSVRIQRAQLLPALTVSFLFDPTIQDPFNTAWFEDVEDTWNQRGGSLSLGLSMAIDPWLPASRARVGIERLELARERLRLSMEQAHRGAELELERLLMSLDKSIGALDALQLNVALAARALALTEDAYNVGARELLEVLDAQLDLETARFELLREEMNYTITIIELEYATWGSTAVAPYTGSGADRSEE